MARLAWASEPYVKMFFKTIILCSFFVGTFSGPTGLAGGECASSCKAPKKFGYKSGNAYYYKYSADIITTISGDDKITTGLHVTALAEIVTSSPCEYVLVLHDATVKESKGESGDTRRSVETSDILVQELIGKPLRFSFDDGNVDTLCTEEEEKTWALNIKRGILSAFQNNMMEFGDDEQVEEVDIHGKCVTSYEGIEYGSGRAILKKSKDLSLCTERPTFVNALQSMPFASNSLVQSLPILIGRQECIQVIEDGKINAVNCEEIHTFDPFNRGEAKAQTLVSQSLTYSSEIRKTVIPDDGAVVSKRRLVYERHVDPISFQGEVPAVLEILNRLGGSQNIDAVSQATYDFIELVDRLRRINYKDFKSIMEKVAGTDAQSYFMDAIPIVASSPSVRMMVDLILDDRLTDEQTDAWLTSLMFIRDPSLDMITEIERLIKTAEPKNQAFLGVSTLLHTYCQTHSNCEDEAEVGDTVGAMYGFLGERCNTSLEWEEERVIYALKGIGNTGLLDGETQGDTRLVNCFKQDSNAIEIRLAALEAFRRVPCDKYDGESMVNIYGDANTDTELRIKAYLMLWKCPSPRLLQQVKQVLTNEAVNQVSWFVWTHLANLKETSSPDKLEIRELLGDDFLISKFNGDARKFSRNYEAAYFTEDENIGGTSEVNVVFTPESFLPRSASVNLTAHLFGKSVNLLEVGGRISSLEQLLEPIFGPNGYFPDQRVTQALHSTRRKRDVRNRMKGLKDLYDHADLHTGGPSGSVYARLFGNEMLYKTLELQGTEFDSALRDKSGKDWLDLNAIFGSLLQGRQIEYQKSSVLMDLSYGVPTGAGVPLTLAVQSAATVGLQASGKIDVEKLWSTHEVDINGKLQPRGAIHVDGLMSIQFGGNVAPIRSGIRLQNELHTSTSIQGELLIKGSKLIHASLSLPQERQEIFKATSQIIAFNGVDKRLEEKVKAETGIETIPGEETLLRCFESKAVGLKVCGEWVVPEDGFSYPPLEGPLTASLYLVKTDSINNYQFDYRFNSDDKEISLGVVFDTPGSQIDRRYTANFLLSAESGKLDASLYTPWTSFGVDGKYSQEQKYFQLSVDVEQEQVLLLNAGLNGRGGKYEPKFIVSIYEHPLVELEGEINVLESRSNADGKANFDLRLKHLTETPITLSGDMSRSGEEIVTRAELVSPVLTGGIRSQLNLKHSPNQQHIIAKLNLDYSWKKSKPVLFDINAKAKRVTRKDLTKLSSTFSFAVRDSPDKSVELTWETDKTTGYCESMLRFTLAKSMWEGRTLYKFQRKSDSFEMALAASLAAPRQGIDYKFEAGFLKNSTITQSKIMGRLRTDREFKAEVAIADESTQLFQTSMVAKALWPGVEHTLRATVKQSEPKDYVLEFVILPNNAKEMKATINYKDASEPNKMEHSLKFRARGFIADPISGNAEFSAADTEAHWDSEIKIERANGRGLKWGASLDCQQVKTNGLRIEGKLSLNDKKYNGELLLRASKNGAKLLTVDLQGGNRILLEATMNGDILGPLSTVVTLYPDKDRRPDHKFEIETYYDRSKLEVTVDYFGARTITSLTYFTTSKIQLNCELWDGKRYSLTVEIPEFQVSNASVFVKVETPIPGYEVMVFSTNFALSDKEGVQTLETRLEGRLNQIEGVLITTGSLGPSEASAMLTVDATGVKSIQGSLKMVWHEHEKSLSIMAGREGERGRAIRAELIQAREAISSGFFFSGCGNIPEITLELEHQMRAQMNSYGKIGWKFESSKGEEISGHLTGTRFPLKGKLVVKSPWRKFEKTEINYAVDLRPEERKLELGFDGGYEFLPVNLKVQAVNNDGNFKYNLLTSWEDGKRSKSYEASAEGYYFSFTDSNVEIKLVAGDRSYDLQWIGEGDYKSQKLECLVKVNKEKYSSGLEWSVHSQSRQTLVSLWLERPGNPRFTLQLDQIAQERKFRLHLLSLAGEEVLFKFVSDLEHRGIYYWNLKGAMEAALDFWPSLEITSRHLAESPGEISHVTTLLLGSAHEMYQLEDGEDSDFAKNNAGKGIFKFDLTQGRVIASTLQYENDNIQITGNLEKSSTSQNIYLNVESTLFSPIQIDATLSDIPYKLALSVGNDETNYVTFSFQTNRDARENSAKLQFETDYGINLKGHAIHNKEQHSLSIQFKEEAMELLDLSFNGQITPTNGQASFTGKIPMFDILPQETTTSLAYVLGEDTQISWKLEQVANADLPELSQSLTAGWSSSEKLLTVLLDDGYGKNCKLEASVMETVATLRCNDGRDSPVLDLKLQYALDTSEYDYGLHTLTIDIASIDFQTIQASISLGLDLDNTAGILRTTLPLRNWENLELAIQMDIQPGTKSLAASAKRNEHLYTAKTFLKTLNNGTQVSLSLTSPHKGFTSLEGSAKYAKGKGIEGGIFLAKETQVIELQAAVRTNQINFKIRTPLQPLQSASGSVAWNLAGPVKTGLVKGEYNGKACQTEAKWSIVDERGEIHVTVTERKKHTLELKYDFKNGYLIEAGVLRGEAGPEVRGKVHITPQLVHIEFKTPIKGYEHIMGKAICASCDKMYAEKYSVRTEWRWNEATGNAQFDLNLGQNKCRLRGDTSIEGYRNFMLTFTHMLDRPQKTVSLEGQFEARTPFKVIYNSNLGDTFNPNSSSALGNVNLQVKIPWLKLDDYQVECTYKREREMHSLVAGLTEGNEKILTMESSLKNGPPFELNAEIQVPTYSLGFEARTKIDFNSLSFLNAHITKEKKKYELEAYVNTGALRILIKTTDGGKSKLVQFTGEHFEGKFKGQFDVDQSKSVIQGEIILKGLENTKLNMELTTPLEAYKSLAFHLETACPAPGKFNAALSFQNEKYRYMLKTEGVHEQMGYQDKVPKFADYKLTLNSPLQGFEHLEASLTYDTREEVSTKVTVTRSGNREMGLEFKLQGKDLKFNIESGIAQYRFTGNVHAKWQAAPYKAMLTVNSAENGGYSVGIDAELHGLRSGDVKIVTGIPFWDNLRFNWAANGHLPNGNALVRCTVGETWERSFRIIWKADSWETIKLDIWAKTDNTGLERGFATQLSLTGQRKRIEKVVIALRYLIIDEEQNLALTLSLKRTQDSVSFDGSLQTPFEVVNVVSAHGKLMFKNDPSIDILVSVNGEVRLATNAILAIKPLKSRFKLNFNAPGLCEPFSVSTQYDVEGTEKFLELAFTQSKYLINVRANATVPEATNSNEIELHMNVASNIPMMEVSASGSMKAGYKIDSEGTRELIVSVNSEKTGKWQVIATLRYSQDFLAKLDILSPSHEIFPTVKFEANYRGSILQGINIESKLQLYDYQPIEIIIAKSAAKLLAEFKSGLTGLEDLKLEAKTTYGAGYQNKKLEIEVVVNDNKIYLNGHINAPSRSAVGAEGSIELSSSWDVIPKGNLKMEMDKQGNINIRGKWGENSVTIIGYSKFDQGFKSWIEGAETFLTLTANNQELATISCDHLISDTVYSINATISDLYKLESYLKTDAEKVLKIRVQFDPTQEISAFVEAGSGRFKTVVSNPWTAPLEAIGMYSLTAKEQLARGSFMYNEQISSLEVSARNSDRTLDFNINVHIPALQQKLDAVLTLRKINDQLVRGNLNIVLSDREVTVEGELTENVNFSSDATKKSKRMKLLLKLPDAEQKEISADITVEYPKSGLSSVLIYGNVSTPTEVTAGTLGYELPINGAQILGMTAKINSPYISKNPLGLRISTNVEKYEFLILEVERQKEEIKLEGRYVFPDFVFQADATLPELFPSRKKFSLDIRSSIDWPRDLSLRISGVCGKENYVAEGEISWKNESASGRVFVNAPRYMTAAKEIVLDIECTESGRHAVSLIGSWGAQRVQVDGQLIIQPENKSGSVKVGGFLGTHFIQGSCVKIGSNYEFGLNAESGKLLRGKRLSVSGNVKPTEDGLEIEANCRTRGEVHSAKMILGMNWVKGKAVLEVKSAAFDSVSCKVDWEYNSATYSTGVTVDIFGEEHQVLLKYNPKSSDVNAVIKCPMLSKKDVLGKGKVVFADNGAHVLADLVWNDGNWRLEGATFFTALNNMELRLDVRTPFDDWDRVTFGGKIGAEEISGEIHTPIFMLPKAELKISGLPLFNLRSLTLTTSVRPLIFLKLPWFSTTLAGVYKLPQGDEPGEFYAGIEYTAAGESRRKQEYKVRLEVPGLEAIHLRMSNPVKLRIEGKFPFENLESVEWELGGRINWKSWVEITAIAEINGKKIEFRSEVGHENGNRRLSLLLKTPFPKYEKYIASIRLDKYSEGGSGRNLLVQFQHPAWQEFIKLEIDYRYRFKSLTDMDGEISITTPKLVVNIPKIMLRLASSLNHQGYQATLNGEWGELKPSLLIRGAMTEESLSAYLEAAKDVSDPTLVKVNLDFLRTGAAQGVENYSFNFLIHYKDEPLIKLRVHANDLQENIDTELQLETQFAQIKSAGLTFRIHHVGLNEIRIKEILEDTNINIQVEHNGNRYFQIELINSAERKSIRIHNPIAPVSFSLVYERKIGEKLITQAEICWDTWNARETTVGFELFATMSAEGRSAAFKAQYPTLGGTILMAAQSWTEWERKQTIKLAWFAPIRESEAQEIGYNFHYINKPSFAKKARSLFLELYTPWRSIQSTLKCGGTDKEMKYSSELKWDLRKDGSKRLGFEYTIQKSASWASRNVISAIRVFHSAFTAQPGFKLHRTYVNQELRYAGLRIQPTNAPREDFILEISQGHLEANLFQFSLFHENSRLNSTVSLKKSPTLLQLTATYVDTNGEPHQGLFLAINEAGHKLCEITAGTERQRIIRVEFINKQYRQAVGLQFLDSVFNATIYAQKPWLEVSTVYDQERSLHLVAGLPHKREAMLRMWRNEEGTTILDLVAEVRLNSSKFIRGNLEWRPQILEDVNYLVANGGIRILAYDQAFQFQNASSAILKEAKLRWQTVNPSLRNTLEHLYTFSLKEIQKISQEITIISDIIMEAYNQNYMYIKDVAELLGDFTGVLKELCSDFCGLLKTFTTMLVEGATTTYTTLTSYAGKLEDTIIPIWDAVDDFLREKYDIIVTYLTQARTALRSLHTNIVSLVEKALEKAEESIMENSFVKQVYEWWEEFLEWKEEFLFGDHIDSILASIDSNIIQPIRDYFQPYLNSVENMLNDGMLQEFLDTPPLPYLIHCGVKVQEALEKFYQFLQAEQTLKTLTTQALQSLDDLIERNIPRPQIIWELEAGKIQFHQPLIFLEWEELTTLPTFSRTSEENEKDFVTLTDYYYKLLDTIQAMKPALDMNIRDILPPFEAHAIMAGEHHFYTFDKTYYRFSGDCSYVLFADLLHKNFTFILNYGPTPSGMRKKSYTILLNPNHVIEIDAATLKVSVDDEGKVDLPTEVGTTFMRRLHNMIEIYDSRGFQITCSQEPAICVFSVSGWYFGKTGGLLGTYDNEPSNDFRSPKKAILQDVTAFAHSWRVGPKRGECRMKNLSGNEAVRADVEGICDSYFVERQSALRPCFSRVDTKVFADMCKYDVSKDVNKASRRESACTAISAYVTECQRQGVDLWLPASCVTCKLDDGTSLTSGENATLTADGPHKYPESADVVILLEQSDCFHKQNVSEIVKRLEGGLRAANLKDNRYALITYGGQGAFRGAHLNAFFGNIWVHSTLFKVPSYVKMDGDGNGDLYNAIEYAARSLKFRAGVSKTFIALTCGSDNCGSETGYPDELTLLLENDIKLHLLTPKPLKLQKTKKGRDANQLFGIDSDGAYTIDHWRKIGMQADKSLKRQIVMPKDFCTPLALESNGTIFQFQKIPSKSFEVWVSRIALTAEPSPCQHCECIPDKSGSPHIICTRCISPRLHKMLKSDDFEDYPTFDVIDVESDM